MKRDGSTELPRFIVGALSTAPTGVTSASTGIPEWQVSAVLEASTSQGLLELGAGGILTRRRSKRVA